MTHVGTKPIETDRLLLRPFALSDAEQMYKNWATDLQVTTWMRWNPHADIGVTRATLEDWVPRYDSPEYYHWGIVLKDSGALIGSIGVLRGTEPGQEDQWEPGYCIGRAFWGQGHTTEALQAVMDYFVPATGAGEDNLISCHAVGNPASGRVMEKAGFVYDHDGVYHRPNGPPVEAKYYRYRPGEGSQ